MQEEEEEVRLDQGMEDAARNAEPTLLRRLQTRVTPAVGAVEGGGIGRRVMMNAPAVVRSDPDIRPTQGRCSGKAFKWMEEVLPPPPAPPSFPATHGAPPTKFSIV
jgi:hypothetical protein